MAWSVPVIAAASGIAQAAASDGTEPQVDLYTIARNPTEDPDSISFGGNDTFHGTRELTFRITYGNHGPDPMPAGAQVNVSLPFDDLWDADTLVAIPSDGYTLTAISPFTTTVPGAKDGYPDMQRKVLPFQVEQEIPAGGQFDVFYRIVLNDRVTTASDFYRVRTASNIYVAGRATDTDGINNSDYADDYVRYNPRMNVDARSMAFLPIEPADATEPTRSYYQGPRSLSFNAIYTNDGPGVLPEGSKITFQLPFSATWETDTFGIVANPYNMALTLEGRESIDLGVNGAYAYRWTYVLDEPIQSGQVLSLTFGIMLNDVKTAATGGTTNARVRTNVIVVGATDTNPGNDGGASDLMYVNGKL